MPGDQSAVRMNPAQATNAQGTQGAQAAQQRVGQGAQVTAQQSPRRKGETIAVHQPPPSVGRHQSISPKKGTTLGQPTKPLASGVGRPGQQQQQIHSQQVVNQAGGQQTASQQQSKGFYTDGGFIPANNDNANRQPNSNQRNQLNGYRNILNKDRYGFQYQNPLYGGQRNYGRQYDNNYDYPNYGYGDLQQPSYNYDYNTGMNIKFC